MSSISNNKRLVKNTIILYGRMLCTMIIALYTSRVVLLALGIDDFGLYNVIGGLVALFSFLMTGMTASTQRFLSYHIAKGDQLELKKTFGNCMSTHLVIAGVILLLAETIGLWFVNNELSISAERYRAAQYIYQFSVLALCLNVITVPYSACVIAHERMNVYAYISILDAVLKLIIAIIVSHANCDHLILYGALMMLVIGNDFLFYKVYCNMKFKESKFYIAFKGSQFKNILSFSSWTLLGQFSQVAANQGTVVLINIFHSLMANAAIGVANQVEGAIIGFSNNFFTAFQLQITKSYASRDYEYLKNLINLASKFSFFLIYILAVPILLNIDFILNIWLKEVPTYTNIFCIIFVISSLISSVSNSLWVSVFATGSIKKLQIASSFLYILDIIIVYLLFKVGLSPIWGPGTKLIINVFIVISRLLFARKQLPFFSIKEFAKNVGVPIALTVFISLLLILPFWNVGHSAFMKICLFIYSFIICCLAVFFVGCNVKERTIVLSYVMKVIKKK